MVLGGGELVDALDVARMWFSLAAAGAAYGFRLSTLEQVASTGACCGEDEIQDTVYLSRNPSLRITCSPTLRVCSYALKKITVSTPTTFGGVDVFMFLFFCC